MMVPIGHAIVGIFAGIFMGILLGWGFTADAWNASIAKEEEYRLRFYYLWMSEKPEEKKGVTP